jgi:hypothetical protein
VKGFSNILESWDISSGIHMIGLFWPCSAPKATFVGLFVKIAAFVIWINNCFEIVVGRSSRRPSRIMVNISVAKCIEILYGNLG